MKKSTTWTIIIIAILVVFGIVLISTPKQKTPEVSGPGVEQVEEVIPEIQQEELALTVLEGTKTEKAEKKKVAVKDFFEREVEIEVSSAGFNPNEFTVKSDKSIKISLTSIDVGCIFRFEHQNLQAVVIEVNKGETGVEFFGIPLVDSYTFYCDGADENLKGLMHFIK